VYDVSINYHKRYDGSAIRKASPELEPGDAESMSGIPAKTIPRPF
jgi:hypothetical protein